MIGKHFVQDILVPKPRRRKDDVKNICLFISAIATLWVYYLLNKPAVNKRSLNAIRKCAIENVQADLSFLDSARPIHTDEFLDRRERLAQALVAANVDAFVLEPGYTFQYYGNVSQTDWEPWEPEERPFLMLILPVLSQSGDVSAKTAFLAPHFEEGRVRMLGIPSREEDLDIVIWEEHWDPYATLLESRLFAGLNGTAKRRAPILVVDEELRDFISRGLSKAGFETVGLTPEVELVRQIKTPAEVEILRAVNTGTVAAVSGARSDGGRVLFEEDGALPHGGFVVGKKKVTEDTMVVIDVGAHYLGYSSDICRSFFIDPVRIDTASHSFPSGHMRDTSNPELREEKLRVWDIVLAAQSAAALALKPNNTAARADIAARSVIEDAGYGERFTHRVGHSIGIKAHESPYLNQWNRETRLQPGMIFTNEPGIYIEGKFGVRHEDVYLVKQYGEAELLTGRRATNPYNP